MSADSVHPSGEADAREAAYRDQTFVRLETRLYDASPLPDWLTSLVLFAFALGSYLALANLSGQPVFDPDSRFLRLSTNAQFGFILSLIFATALTLGRRSDQLYRRFKGDFEAVLKPGGAYWRLSARVLKSYRPAFLLAGLTGAAVGIIPNLFVMSEYLPRVGLPAYIASIGGWFLIAIPVNLALFGRAVADSAMDSRVFAQVIEEEFEADPLAPERAAVFGRLAVNGALSWLVFVGIGILFMVAEGAGTLSAVLTVFFAILLGVVAFMNAARPVNKAMKEAKEAALQSARAALKSAAEAAYRGDDHAAQRLPGLIAMEARLARAPEWPISGDVAGRLALYGLIPIVPWFGAAFAEEIVGSLLSG
ncbi:MAG: hypothetical protein AAFX03_09865 [Pseudomonadota bacterium]